MQLETSHLLRSRLKAAAPEKVYFNDITLETAHKGQTKLDRANAVKNAAFWAKDTKNDL